MKLLPITNIPKSHAEYNLSSRFAAELIGVDIKSFVAEHVTQLPCENRNGKDYFNYYDLLNYSVRIEGRKTHIRTVFDDTLSFLGRGRNETIGQRCWDLKFTCSKQPNLNDTYSIIQLPRIGPSTTKARIEECDRGEFLPQNRIAFEAAHGTKVNMLVELNGASATLEVPADLKKICQDFVHNWQYHLVPDNLIEDIELFESMRITDCWSCTKYLGRKIADLGYQVRKVEGFILGNLCQNHGWLEVLIGDEWVSIDASLALIQKEFYPEANYLESVFGSKNNMLSCIYQDEQFLVGMENASNFVTLTASISDTVLIDQKCLLNPSVELPPQEMEKLKNIRAHCSGKTIDGLFHEMAAKLQSQTAIYDNDREVSYSEILRTSDRIVSLILQAGTETSSVAIIMPSGTHFVSTLLAILRLGYRAVMFDLDWPKNVIEERLAQVDTRLILTTIELEFLGKEFELVNVTSLPTDIELCSAPTVLSEPNGGFLFFTSGSSGQPKAVFRSHLSCLAGQIPGMQFVSLDQSDCMLVSANPSSIRIISEIFWPLLHEARIAIADPDQILDHQYLEDLVTTRKVTAMNGIPSQLDALIETDGFRNLTTLKHIFLLGEPLRSGTVENLIKLLGASVYNGFAMTEASPILFWRCENGVSSNLPIGRPAPPTIALMIDEKDKLIAGEGLGELIIGGPIVSDGYHNQKINNKKIDVDAGNGEVLSFIRSGDLVRRTADGIFYYLGRSDDQMKIRGVTIDPLEIESVVNDLEEVIRSIAVKVDYGSTENIVLLAKLNTTHFDERSILRRIKSRLRESAVPSSVLQLDEIPMLPSGKIDREKAKIFARNRYLAKPTKGIKAQSLMETKLCLIIEDVTGRSGFELDCDLGTMGVNSLERLRIATKISSFASSENSVTELMRPDQSIQDLARLIKKREMETM